MAGVRLQSSKARASLYLHQPQVCHFPFCKSRKFSRKMQGVLLSYVRAWSHPISPREDQDKIQDTSPTREGARQDQRLQPTGLKA